jgi:hypothetical protein
MSDRRAVGLMFGLYILAGLVVLMSFQVSKAVHQHHPVRLYPVHPEAYITGIIW